MSVFERRPVLTLGSVLLVVLVILLAVTEYALSLTQEVDLIRGGQSLPRPGRYVQLREWLPDAEFQFAPPENRRQTPGGALYDVYRLRIDSNGFIEPSAVHERPDVSIAFLGGSTTECMYVTPERRFPHLVGRLLEEDSGLKVNTLNGGKSGNTTMHSIHALSGKVVPLRPDAVVLMHNVNDLGVLSRFGTYWPDDAIFGHLRTRERSLEHVFRELRDMAIPRTYRAARSALRQIGGLRAAAPAAAAGREARAGPKPARHAKTDKWARDFESALRHFVNTAKAWHVTPVLMTQALVGRDRQAGRRDPADYLERGKLERRGFTRASFGTTHDYFNEIIRYVAGTEGAILIDLARVDDWSGDDQYDGMHFTDAGSAKAARIIADALRPHLQDWVKSRPK